MRMMRPVRTLLAITATTALVAALTPGASAAIATANITVSATVTNNCTVTTNALAFPSYDPVVANATAPLDGTGAVSVACTRGATATVGLSGGGNPSGGTRRLREGSSTNYLTYELYSDAGFSAVWDDSPGLNLLAAPSRVARNFTVYGRVAGTQDVPAGTYGDTVLATVNF